MPGRLQAELRQSRPFDSPATEAYLNLLRTADALQRELEEILKPAGISQPQYNVLRILRGAGGEGLACSEIGERMITRDPDMTRLLDRLESRGMVARARGQRDRRVVKTRITAKGLQLLKELDVPLRQAQARLLGRLGERRLRALIRLLEEVREQSS